MTRARIPLSHGRQVRDFVHVDDCVAALMMLSGALERRGLGAAGAYNVASGVPSSVSDFARYAAVAMQADPALLGFGDIATRPDDVAWLVGNPALIRGETNWVPRFALQEGIATALDESIREVCI
jgi:UDP-glucose 4-epimerase